MGKEGGGAAGGTAPGGGGGKKKSIKKFFSKIIKRGSKSKGHVDEESEANKDDHPNVYEDKQREEATSPVRDPPNVVSADTKAPIGENTRPPATPTITPVKVHIEQSLCTGKGKTLITGTNTAKNRTQPAQITNNSPIRQIEKQNDSPSHQEHSYSGRPVAGLNPVSLMNQAPLSSASNHSVNSPSNPSYTVSSAPRNTSPIRISKDPYIGNSVPLSKSKDLLGDLSSHMPSTIMGEVPHKTLTSPRYSISPVSSQLSSVSTPSSVRPSSSATAPSPQPSRMPISPFPRGYHRLLNPVPSSQTSVRSAAHLRDSSVSSDNRTSRLTSPAFTGSTLVPGVGSSSLHSVSHPVSIHQNNIAVSSSIANIANRENAASKDGDDDSSQEVIPKKKRRPRSANSLTQESRTKCAMQVQTTQQEDSETQRTPDWRARLSSPISTQSNPPKEPKNFPKSSRIPENKASSVLGVPKQLDVFKNYAKSFPSASNTDQPTSTASQVIHYHLNIQNCDGLNLHVHNPQSLNTEGGVSITQSEGEESSIDWSEPIASSSLLRDHLAAHDLLNDIDNESVTDSMTPLFMDETRSDMTGDTTALMDMDAWGYQTSLEHKSSMFDKLHKLALADGLGSRDRPERLSQRAHPVVVPTSRQPFNPPWRHSSRQTSPGKKNSDKTQSSTHTSLASVKDPQRKIKSSPVGQTQTSSTSTQQSSSQFSVRNPLLQSRVPVPSTESTGTQFPSLSRRPKPFQNRTNTINLPEQSSASKPIAKVAPQARATIMSNSQAATSPRGQAVNADMDALLVEYLVNNPPDNFSETSDTISNTSDDENFVLTDDEGSVSGGFSRFGLASTIQPTLRRQPQGRHQQHPDDDDSEEELNQENIVTGLAIPRLVLTLEERVANIRGELVRVPGVLIVSTRRNRIVVFLSQDRPNVEGVAMFMHDHNIGRAEFEVEILPWRYRNQAPSQQQPTQQTVR